MVATLTCASFGKANSPYFTFSGWINVPATGTSYNHEIFNFGAEPSDPEFNYNYLQINHLNTDLFGLTLSLYGSELAIFDQYYGTASTTPSIFSCDAWHHVMIACDMSPESVDTTIPNGTATGWYKVSDGAWDGITHVEPTIAWDSPALPGIVDVFANGSSTYGFYYHYGEQTYSAHSGISAGKIIKTVIDGDHIPHHDQATSPVDNYEARPPLSDYGYANSPGWSIQCNAQEFGVPARAQRVIDSPTSYKPYRMSDWQFWMGQYIDPTDATNFSKVVEIRDGNGYPRNPSIAAAAFGTQSVLLKGKASDGTFYVNRGNGGTLVVPATWLDYTPTPGTAPY